MVLKWILHKNALFIQGIFLVLIMACSNNTVSINPDDIPDDSLSVEYITKQIEVEPKNPGLYSLRAQIYFANNQLELAVKDALIALRLDSLKSQYYLQLSDYYIAAGKSENAKNTLQSLTKNLPEYAHGWVALAKLHLYVKDYKSVEKYLAEAKTIDPEIGQIYFVQGLVHYENNEKTLAADQFLLSIEKEPTLYESYEYLGLLYAERKDSLAIQYFETAIRLKPEVIEPYYSKALLLQDFGKYEQAIEAYQDIIINHDSTYIYAYFNQGYIYLNFLDDTKKAISFFERALYFKPDYVDVIYNIGLCYEVMKDFKKAQEYYNKALDMSENFPLAIEGLNRLDKKY